MARFFILFVVILAALFAAELTAPVQRAVVVPWTQGLVRISADLITFYSPHVTVVDNVLRSTTNGFAFPSGQDATAWKRRLFSLLPCSPFQRHGSNVRSASSPV
jgi:hypothetical protein